MPEGSKPTRPSRWERQREPIVAVSDAELVEQVRLGDDASFTELYLRHRDSAERLARSLARPSEVDDLVSEAFVGVLSQLRGGKGPEASFRAYLLTSLRHNHYTRLRSEQRIQVTDDEETLDTPVNIPDSVLLAFENESVRQAFLTLPENWQTVLWHLEVEKERPAQIASLLGISANSVSALAYRAKEGLRQAYLRQHVTDVESSELCQGMVDQLPAYVRGKLSSRNATAVERHLEECHDCYAAFLELTEMNASLAAVLAPAILGTIGFGYAASVPVMTISFLSNPLQWLYDKYLMAAASAGPVATNATIAGSALVLATATSVAAVPAIRDALVDDTGLTVAAPATDSGDAAESGDASTGDDGSSLTPTADDPITSIDLSDDLAAVEVVVTQEPLDNLPVSQPSAAPRLPNSAQNGDSSTGGDTSNNAGGSDNGGTGGDSTSGDDGNETEDPGDSTDDGDGSGDDNGTGGDDGDGDDDTNPDGGTDDGDSDSTSGENSGTDNGGGSGSGSGSGSTGDGSGSTGDGSGSGSDNSGTGDDGSGDGDDATDPGGDGDETPGGGDNPDPVDPVDPVDPTDPVDPVDPTDPVDPVDPEPTVVTSISAGAAPTPTGNDARRVVTFTPTADATGDPGMVALTATIEFSRWLPLRPRVSGWSCTYRDAGRNLTTTATCTTQWDTNGGVTPLTLTFEPNIIDLKGTITISGGDQLSAPLEFRVR